jgi:predicted DNA-binding protein
MRRKKEDDLRSTSITIRLTPAIKERLERTAKKDRRTVSSLVEIFIELGLSKSEDGSAK